MTPGLRRGFLESMRHSCALSGVDGAATGPRQLRPTVFNPLHWTGRRKWLSTALRPVSSTDALVFSPRTTAPTGEHDRFDHPRAPSSRFGFGRSTTRSSSAVSRARRHAVAHSGRRDRPRQGPVGMLRLAASVPPSRSPGWHVMTRLIWRERGRRGGRRARGGSSLCRSWGLRGQARSWIARGPLTRGC
jgi:hypothetical protein